MTQVDLSSSASTETDIGHAAFTSIKDQLNLIDVNLEKVMAALPAAIHDGLSELLASEAKTYLQEIQQLSNQMKSLHLKAHVKFRAGIETAFKDSSFSKRVPT